MKWHIRLKFLLMFVSFYIVVTPLVGLIGIPIGLAIVFFKTGGVVFDINKEIDTLIYIIKIGTVIGFILGAGLWIIAEIDRYLKNRRK
ncbi:hypothetical protein [Dickeya sp. ws52]|uniref:hypothetical protein n=1 Tax=Dickeya sp. ws52 TaxID=2576377 RepID=UPI00117CD7AD|nr:hypothetical protein [Dickeya sp. ws52]TYL41293.1 hypothetical protein FDP13_18120 [Dickeya sp. ws52]